MADIVQQLPVQAQRPPVISTGVLGWLRANLFNSVFNTILTLLAVYLLEGHRGRGTSWPAVVVLVLGLTFSGTGIVAVFFAGVFVTLRRGWRVAFPVVAVPALVFVVWYVAIGHIGAKPSLTDRWDYLGVAHYVWLGLMLALIFGLGWLIQQGGKPD